MRLSVVATSLFIFAFAAHAVEEKEAPAGKVSRTFEFSYTAKVKELPAGAQSISVWIPIPQSNAHQDISDVKFVVKSGAEVVDAQPEVATEPVLNNKMAFWKAEAAKAVDASVTMTFKCTRKEVAAVDISKGRELNDEEKKDLAKWLAANRLVLVGGTFDAVAEAAIKTAKKPDEIAKAAYDYTVATMKYDKPADKKGWGQGSTQWACDARFGNCTDFHAMFMSLGRTKGVPVKFEMGFPIPVKDAAKPETTNGPVAGYHCWAKFYLGGVGWVPVDASEAQRHEKLRDYYFGNLTADRVQFTNGRDVTLVPKQASEPLNYFIYPYAEADGKPFAVERAFSFKDVP